MIKVEEYYDPFEGVVTHEEEDDSISTSVENLNDAFGVEEEEEDDALTESRRNLREGWEAWGK